MRGSTWIVACFIAGAAIGSDEFKPPALMVRPDADQPSRPLDLSKVHVDLAVAGESAATRVTMTFANTLDRPLEGNLYVPLPQGAAVSGYALDIDRQLVDAVAVERQRARQIFEYEERKGIDPGLLEWSTGNNFQTRVWPIPARGSRTVRISYVTPLATGKVAGEVVYRLPLGQYGKLAELSIRVLTPGEAVAEHPNWIKTSNAEGGRVLEGMLANAKAAGDLVLTLKPPKTATVVGMGPQNRDVYFVTRLSPAISASNAKRSTGGTLMVYWDASLSRANSDLKKEYDLLTRAVTQFGFDRAVVTAFRNVPDEPKAFDLTSDPAKGAAAIVEYLHKLPYDGGTNLSALSIAPPKGVTGRAALLFTDGLANLGPDLPAAIKLPVYTVASDARANHPLLAEIAAQSGGAYFNLNATAADAAIQQFDQPTFRLLRAEYDPEQVADFLPLVNTPASGRFTVAGRLKAPEAKIVLRFGRKNDAMHTETLIIKRDAANASGGELASHLWAQMKVDSLLGSPERHRDELLRIGKEFGLATPATSLLVLETVEQYLDHGIEPPRSRAKVFAEWNARIEDRKVKTTKSKEERLAAVVAKWNERVAWWEKEYKVAPNFVYNEPPIDARQKRMQEATGRVITKEALAAGEQSAIPIPETSAPKVEANRGLMHNPGGAKTKAAKSDAGAKAMSGRSPVETLEADRVSAVVNRRGGDAPAPAKTDAKMKQANGSGGNEPPIAYISPRAWEELSARRQKYKALAKDDADDAVAALGIKIQAWDPKTPYLAAMEKAGDSAYAVYLDWRFKFAKSPAFYFDCAEFFFRHKQPALGLRVLTNVGELELTDAPLTRIVAHRLQQLGQYDLAIDLFERVQVARPEEPQSYRDLALALGDRADQVRKSNDSNPAVLDDYRRAVALLNEVVVRKWDDRFPDVELIAIAEANRILARMATLTRDDRWEPPLDRRLRKLLELDVWIALTWDADNTDIDLWVTEPTREKCMYNHNRTVAGGLMTSDFTGGYGPEVYMLRRTLPGQYRIEADFYGANNVTLAGGATIQATIITNFGRPNEDRQSLSVRVRDKKEVVSLGTITLGAAK